MLAKEKIVVISVWCGMDYRNDDKYDDKQSPYIHHEGI